MIPDRFPCSPYTLGNVTLGYNYVMGHVVFQCTYIVPNWQYKIKEDEVILWNFHRCRHTASVREMHYNYHRLHCAVHVAQKRGCIFIECFGRMIVRKLMFDCWYRYVDIRKIIELVADDRWENVQNTRNVFSINLLVGLVSIKALNWDWTLDLWLYTWLNSYGLICCRGWAP